MTQLDMSPFDTLERFCTVRLPIRSVMQLELYMVSILHLIMDLTVISVTFSVMRARQLVL